MSFYSGAQAAQHPSAADSSPVYYDAQMSNIHETRATFQRKLEHLRSKLTAQREGSHPTNTGSDPCADVRCAPLDLMRFDEELHALQAKYQHRASLSTPKHLVAPPLDADSTGGDGLSGLQASYGARTTIAALPPTELNLSASSGVQSPIKETTPDGGTGLGPRRHAASPPATHGQARASPRHLPPAHGFGLPVKPREAIAKSTASSHNRVSPQYTTPHSFHRYSQHAHEDREQEQPAHAFPSSVPTSRRSSRSNDEQAPYYHPHGDAMVGRPPAWGGDTEQHQRTVVDSIAAEDPSRTHERQSMGGSSASHSSEAAAHDRAPRLTPVGLQDLIKKVHTQHHNNKAPTTMRGEATATRRLDPFLQGAATVIGVGCSSSTSSMGSKASAAHPASTKASVGNSRNRNRDLTGDAGGGALSDAFSDSQPQLYVEEFDPHLAAQTSTANNGRNRRGVPAYPNAGVPEHYKGNTNPPVGGRGGGNLSATTAPTVPETRKSAAAPRKQLLSSKEAALSYETAASAPLPSRKMLDPASTAGSTRNPVTKGTRLLGLLEVERTNWQTSLRSSASSARSKTTSRMLASSNNAAAHNRAGTVPVPAAGEKASGAKGLVGHEASGKHRSTSDRRGRSQSLSSSSSYRRGVGVATGAAHARSGTTGVNEGSGGVAVNPPPPPPAPTRKISSRKSSFSTRSLEGPMTITAALGARSGAEQQHSVACTSNTPTNATTIRHGTVEEGGGAAACVPLNDDAWPYPVVPRTGTSLVSPSAKARDPYHGMMVSSTSGEGGSNPYPKNHHAAGGGKYDPNFEVRNHLVGTHLSNPYLSPHKENNNGWGADGAMHSSVPTYYQPPTTHAPTSTADPFATHPAAFSAGSSHTSPLAAYMQQFYPTGAQGGGGPPVVFLPPPPVGGALSYMAPLPSMSNAHLPANGFGAVAYSGPEARVSSGNPRDGPHPFLSHHDGIPSLDHDAHSGGGRDGGESTYVMPPRAASVVYLHRTPNHTSAMHHGSPGAPVSPSIGVNEPSGLSGYSSLPILPAGGGVGPYQSLHTPRSERGEQHALGGGDVYPAPYRNIRVPISPLQMTRHKGYAHTRADEMHRGSGLPSSFDNIADAKTNSSSGTEGRLDPNQAHGDNTYENSNGEDWTQRLMDRIRVLRKLMP